MIITIYIEYIFVVNFLMNYISIYITQVILGLSVKKVGICAFFATLLYIGTITLFGVNNITSVISCILGPVFVCGVETTRRKGTFLLRLATLYVVTVILGVVMGGFITYTYPGYLIITFLKNKSSIIALTIWIVYAWTIFKLFIKGIGIIRDRIFNNLRQCDILLIYGEKRLRVKGLIDSGNSLYYGVEKHPVSIVEYEVIKDLLNEPPSLAIKLSSFK